MSEALVIPEGQAVCPCCNGTKIGAEMTEQQRKWYPGRTHFACMNCGGQTMYGGALGYTKVNPQTGLGCKHEFVGRNAGRCYTKYTCTHGCGYGYDIDSGD